MGKNIPNIHKIGILKGHKQYQMTVNVATFSIARPSKIYPNWDFWF
jgi:hypothetical protein